MARTGINFVDVIKAAKAVRAAGQDPTVDRVREHLGTGSKSTIAPLLKRWRSEEGDVIDAGGLPTDLLEVVKSVYARIQQIADDRIEDAQQEFQSIKEGLLQELTGARNIITQVTTKQEESVLQNRQLTEEKLFLTKSLEDTRLNLAKVEAQHDTATARVADLTATAAELKQENRDIRNHFEHYQERIAEDRQLEREQYRANQRQLQDQLQTVTNQLAQAELRVLQLQKTNEELRSSVDEQKLAEQISQIELEGKSAEVKRLNHELAESLKVSHDLNAQVEQLRNKATEQAGQVAHGEKVIALLTQSLQKTENDLRITTDKALILMDENKLVLQEKAVLQGQLTQIQRSL